MMKTTQLTVRGLLVSLHQRDETLQSERRQIQQQLDKLDEKILANRNDIERLQLLTKLSVVKEDGAWTTR
jgi:uncharacterized protein YlxW (UPF0749 family)